MYLKEIIASGFKSFADRFDIKLDDKTTCIVGPNGSGKSNVVDAVRWVLGEQSVKSLRGENSMSDVIFSGSKSRNPLNVAYVELIFDNTDHFLAAPYTEISIKRRVYRSGENEYYLNGEKCRLKDINNLLLDTGMGKESFNIISQGEVEKILSSSATDRRVIFEEAAGILKYRKRKEEALRKLDRTHNNIDRVNDIIGELELQIGPLKEQSEKASEYLENKKGLDKYEVALLAFDITNYNHELEEAKASKEKLEKEILTISSETSKDDVLSLENNNKLEKLEKEKANLNKELLEVSEEALKLDNERQLLKEKSKTTKSEDELLEENRKLLDEKFNLEGKKEVIKTDLEHINSEYNNISLKQKELTSTINGLKSKKNMLNSEYSSIDQMIISLTHKVNSLTSEIEQGGDLPNSVRNILNSKSLMGIHNTIGNIISIDDKYINALNVAISSNKNFIITSDEEASKKAINYLKDNHLGRATFFPLNVIKSRYIDNITLNKIKDNPDYIGILSDFISYNQKYKNIIENQFGTIILSKDMDSALRLSKIIDNKYRIITLLGDVINVGGSMSGGSTYKTSSTILLKQELKYAEDKKKKSEEELNIISEQINSLNKQISELEEKYSNISREEVTIIEKQTSKKNEFNELSNRLEKLEKEISSVESIKDNSISEKEQELIKLYHEKNTVKEQIILKLKNIDNEILQIKQLIEEQQATEKLNNYKLRNLEKEDRDLEIVINRLDVKIDNMLTILSEDYELTYEKAFSDYKLDIEPDEARRKVNVYRANIKRIGMVNIDAIEEYERVNTRYEFLTKQREDLSSAEDTLLEIMNEMDAVMKEEFKNTFEAVREEFKKVFKELFNGGQADLKLTVPEDLLTTGVEIVASPPGKKLTSISLLSGGEKTLTAISLLFAILNVRTVPFCLFDEVEAALDEANVAQFGKYLEHYKNKTQFLIITHKKKTMEYANTLYGITMQESGVSKLVSVKLTEKEDYL